MIQVPPNNMLNDSERGYRVMAEAISLEAEL